MTSSTTSEFYLACRNGFIDQVREQLPQMSLEEINRKQSNGSTALHAACYYGHEEIVKLLLDKGASRSIQNEYKCLPYDEAKTETIKKFFVRKTATRFSDDGSGHIDWMKCDVAAEELAREYRIRHKGFGWKSQNIDHRIAHIKEEMTHAEKEEVSLFLTQAQTNPYCLLKAYTVENGFYTKLNEDLAIKHFNQGTNFGITYFIDFFYNYPAFSDLSFKGEVYRGMCITQDDLKQYSVGGKVMNKAFMSTTKVRSVAEEFAKKIAVERKKEQGTYVKLSALCTYEIVNDRTGLDIENVSEYQREKEVLIGPYSAFEIQAIRQIAPNYVEIDLRECKQQVNHQDSDSNDDDDDDE